MPINNLADRALSNAKPRAKEYLLADGEGLFLRVRPSGAKDWLFIFTFNGRRLKMGLGSYGESGKRGVSLATARDEAARARNKLALGLDPHLERREREAKEASRRVALESDKAKAAARLTVGALLDRWQADYLAHKRKDGGAEIRRSFTKDVLPALGAVHAEDVSRGMVANVLDVVVRRGSPVIANYLLADLRQMFEFARARQIIELNPCVGLTKAQFGGSKVERDRVLSEAEIRNCSPKFRGRSCRRAPKRPFG